jgi:glycosyltransferase involved in cell wall biosynthesis
MRSAVFMVPGRIDTRTGGYGYDRRVVSGLRDRGWTILVRELGDGFPQPAPAARAEASRFLAECADAATVVVDGLALGALPDEMEREAARLRIVGLVHLPLATEVGLAPDVARRLEASERRALRYTTSIVVTGRSTAATLAGYEVPPEKMVLVEPGTDPAPLARGSTGSPAAGGDASHCLHLVSAATLSRRKGHDVLFNALGQLRHLSWRLTCAGSLDRDAPTVARLREQLGRLKLEDRVSFVGELDEDELGSLYGSADVFVLATLHESYCMAVAEALARGLPVVATTTGAIPDLVSWPGRAPGDAAAGLLVPPGDPDSLRDALSTVIGDATLRDRLAAGARHARDRLPTWGAVLDKMELTLTRAAHR